MLKCEHLKGIEVDLLSTGIAETYRGQPWSKNCREWVYFDCVFDFNRLTNKYKLADCIVHHINDDPRSGLEAGMVCTICNDAIIGVHPSLSTGKKVFD